MLHFVAIEGGESFGFAIQGCVFVPFCGANNDTDSCTDELSVSQVSSAKWERRDLTAGTEIREFGQAVCLWGAKYCLFACFFGGGFATFFFVEANWEETITPSGSDRGGDDFCQICCYEAFCAFPVATAERRVVGVCGAPSVLSLCWQGALDKNRR